jgi:hypothetical protein
VVSNDGNPVVVNVLQVLIAVERKSRDGGCNVLL